MNNSETVKLILPLPPPELSPNRPPGSRGGRMKKAAIAKNYRTRAKQVAIESGIESGPWGKATAQATFFHAIERRRDDVNHLAMLKPAYDGIVEAGLLVDDDSEHLTTLPAEFKLDKPCPRVEIIITRVKED